MKDHAILIDQNGYYIDLYNIAETPPEPKKGQILVGERISEAILMVKPKWNGSAWSETATREEIEAYYSQQRNLE